MQDSTEDTGRQTYWSRLLHGTSRYHILVFVGCWLGGIFDGMDSTLMTVVLPKAVGELLGTSQKEQVAQTGAYISAIFLLGWTLGGVLFGWIGDRLGRVKSIIVSILLYALFTGLAGLSQTWWQLAICRFLTGLGIGGELVSITTFLTEVWPKHSRAVAIGCLITSYQAGVFLAGGVNYIFESWRLVFFVGALPALLVILLRLSLKESDKWLADQEKHADASHWEAVFEPSNRPHLLIGGLTFGALLIGYWASLSWIPTWIQSLLPEGSSGVHERSIATMCQGIGAIVGCMSAGFLADHLGRKLSMILSFIGCFIASWLLFQTNSVFSASIYWQSAFLGYFIGLNQAGLYIYLPELFPTRVRATATGFCLNAGRVATILAVLFIGMLVQALGGYGQAAFAFSFTYLIGMLVMCFALETRHRELPE